MALNGKQIKEFQVIHKRMFGTQISKQQTMVEGLALIRLVSLIQPMLRGDNDDEK